MLVEGMPQIHGGLAHSPGWCISGQRNHSSVGAYRGAAPNFTLPSSTEREPLTDSPEAPYIYLVY